MCALHESEQEKKGTRRKLHFCGTTVYTIVKIKIRLCVLQACWKGNRTYLFRILERLHFPIMFFVFFFYIAIPSCNIKKYFRSLSKEEKKNREIVIIIVQLHGWRTHEGEVWRFSWRKNLVDILEILKYFFSKLIKGGQPLLLIIRKKKLSKISRSCNLSLEGRTKVKFDKFSQTF